MKKKKLRILSLHKQNIASLSNSKMINGGGSFLDGGGVIYDIHTNPLDTNTNPLPTAVDTNTIIGDTITEITETAHQVTTDPIGTGGPPPMNKGTFSCPGAGVC